MRQHERLKKAVMAMPYVDRVCLLTGSILEKDRHEIAAAVLGLVELAARLSVFMIDDKRFRLADRIRDCADRIEHQSSKQEVYQSVVKD